MEIMQISHINIWIYFVLYRNVFHKLEAAIYLFSKWHAMDYTELDSGLEKMCFVKPSLNV